MIISFEFDEVISIVYESVIFLNKPLSECFLMLVVKFRERILTGAYFASFC